MARNKEAIVKQIDALIKEVKDNPNISEDEIDVEVGKLQDELSRAKADKDEATQQTLHNKIDEVMEAIKTSKINDTETIDKIVSAIGEIKIPAPQVTVEPTKVDIKVPPINVPPVKIPEIKIPKTEIKYPDSFSIKKPSWLPTFSLKPVTDSINNLIQAIPQVKWPTAAKDAIAVRLSDGEKFYKALGSFASGIVDIMTFKTSNGAKAAALVDSEGIVQVKDTALATSIDSLETILTNIASYTDGLETLLTAIQGYVDTLETKLQSVIDNTDQLEGYVDGLETLGTALNGYVDQLEGYVDGIEGYLDTVETKLQSVIDNTAQVVATYDHGSNLDVDTTAEQLPSQAASFGVTVKAGSANTGIVYVGKSDVTAGTTDATDGFPLDAGESITLPLNNANLIYVIGSANNQKVYWIAV